VPNHKEWCIVRLSILTQTISGAQDVTVIPASVAAKMHCIQSGIPISALSFASGELDVMIDGADEVDSTMALIKGGSFSAADRSFR
jgi:ribose 5-phosphate isomerase